MRSSCISPVSSRIKDQTKAAWFFPSTSEIWKTCNIKNSVINIAFTHQFYSKTSHIFTNVSCAHAEFSYIICNENYLWSTSTRTHPALAKSDMACQF
jgi:hypothetical protein